MTADEVRKSKPPSRRKRVVTVLGGRNPNRISSDLGAEGSGLFGAAMPVAMRGRIERAKGGSVGRSQKSREQARPAT